MRCNDPGFGPLGHESPGHGRGSHQGLCGPVTAGDLYRGVVVRLKARSMRVVPGACCRIMCPGFSMKGDREASIRPCPRLSLPEDGFHASRASGKSLT
jgi:hypothetical protein